MGEMRNFLAFGERGNDAVDVFACELVVVCDLDALGGCVDEKHLIIRFALLHHHDAGCDACAEKEVAGQLDDAVDVVVVNQVFADFLLCAAAIHDAGETDDSRRSVGSQPTEAVHDERHVRLALRRKHTGRGEARVVDEQRIVIARPLD